MSLTNRKSGTGNRFLNLSAYNRFRSRTSRRSDSSNSDAESIQPSQAEEQEEEESTEIVSYQTSFAMSLTNSKSGTRSLFVTLSGYNRFRRRTSRRSDNSSSISDAESIQPSQAEEQGSSATRTGAIEVGLAAGPVFAWWRRRNFDVPAEEHLEVHLAQLKRFSLRELQVATDSFRNKNILGRGGFATVYKGRLTDGSIVAVKRLTEERFIDGEDHFQMEVKVSSMAVHRNLLRLRGFCLTRTERLLVYPYMANGSVASCLRGRSFTEPPLDWPTRWRIALVSACGLSYLHDHCHPKIIHRNVKAANILLDEEFKAVVGGFGLAKPMDCDDTHGTTTVAGTFGYIAPEYLIKGECSEKTDVFGFGIMLLELITGQRAHVRLANDDDAMLLDWVKGILKEKRLEMLVDPDLQNNNVKLEVETLIQIALLCTQDSPMERPKMSEVVRMLEGDGLAERWKEWQKAEVRQVAEMVTRYSEWIHENSMDNLQSIELSSPR